MVLLEREVHGELQQAVLTGRQVCGQESRSDGDIWQSIKDLPHRLPSIIDLIQAVVFVPASQGDWNAAQARTFP